MCVIGIYSKYAWVVSLKHIKCINIITAFEKILYESVLKAIKIWVDKGSKFYNRLIKSCLQGNDRGMYSRHNEGKPTVTKRFIRTLKKKTYNYMTSLYQKMCILIN